MEIDGVAKGMVAGAIGVAAMTAMEKVEQRFTGRPNSYVPARTLARMLRLQRPLADRPVRNHAMHWGTGILLGGVRGVMARHGWRGARASALHVVARLSTDQTLENATGVGSPPWTWPRQELAIDVAHKAVYSFVTGWVADRLVPSRDGCAAGANAVPAAEADSTPARSVLGPEASAEPAHLPDGVFSQSGPTIKHARRTSFHPPSAPRPRLRPDLSAILAAPVGVLPAAALHSGDDLSTRSPSGPAIRSIKWSMVADRRTISVRSSRPYRSIQTGPAVWPKDVPASGSSRLHI